MDFIPQNCTKEPDIELQNKTTEWRWFVYKINGKKYIEISMKKPNEERLYATKDNQWIKQNIDKSYEKFIIDRYYYYPKNN
jgi:hypothetical protein